MRSLRRPLLALALVLLTAAPAHAARSRWVAVRGAKAPGPARYDVTHVREFGPASAKRVLVLVPGFIGGAGDFTEIAQDIVRRVPGLQVWAWDRRSNAFEDTSVFAGGDPDAAFGYYLNLKPVNGKSFQPVAGSSVPFVRDWGLKVELGDLRQVVLRARAHGRRQVILGGHSLGGSTTVAYAAWDFGGRPGYKDLRGLVLIDGGLLGTFATPSLKEVKQRLATLRKGDPFSDLLGNGLPGSAGAFAEVAALYAQKKPNEPSVLQQFPLIPPNLKPPVPATNEAALGFAFDASTGPAALSLIQVHAGQLAANGDPRPWQAGELTPLARLEAGFTTEPGNAVEWYFPDRLRLDVDGANLVSRNPISNFLRLREFHRARVNLPLYAFETNLTHGRVLRGARRFVRSSRVPRSRLVADHGQSHLDPLLAAPSKNRFLKTVVPFLKRLR
jgi:pimeloyl-ACP methyl ester carboxylesterase